MVLEAWGAVIARASAHRAFQEVIQGLEKKEDGPKVYQDIVEENWYALPMEKRWVTKRREKRWRRMEKK